MVARTAGRKGRPWRRLQQWVWANYTHCYRCGGYVDQTIANPRHPRARSVDHVLELVLDGAPASRDNVRLSHFGCNASAGARLRNARAAVHAPQRVGGAAATASRAW